jgi:hypothetical protein
LAIKCNITKRAIKVKYYYRFITLAPFELSLDPTDPVCGFFHLKEKCHAEIDHYGSNSLASDDDKLCCLGTLTGQEMIDQSNDATHDDHADAALKDRSPYIVRPDVSLPVINEDEHDHLKDTCNRISDSK